MSTHLYHWPESSAVGRVVPKSRFYENAKVSAALKHRFVDEVQRITWAFKLSPSTVNLNPTSSVEEIQIFRVEAKTGDVSDQVLLAISGALSHPVVFEIEAQSPVGSGAAPGRRVRMAAPDPGTDGGQRRGLHSIPWVTADTAVRAPLPAALDLQGLLVSILKSVLPVDSPASESLDEALDRSTAVERHKREIARLERSLRTEIQLNRKLELRRELRAQQSELEGLM